MAMHWARVAPSSAIALVSVPELYGRADGVTGGAGGIKGVAACFTAVAAGRGAGSSISSIAIAAGITRRHGWITRCLSYGALPRLAGAEQRVAGHRRRRWQGEQRQQSWGDIGEAAVLHLPDREAGGLTTINGTGFSVWAVCGAPVSGSRIISALP